jgi:hypothetical protein
MTYDQWKATDPRDYERDESEEEQPSELELAYDRIAQLEHNSKGSADRITKLEAELLECLEYFKKHYDVNDGDYGEPAPNTEMQLGTSIEETLYGIRF